MQTCQVPGAKKSVFADRNLRKSRTFSLFGLARKEKRAPRDQLLYSFMARHRDRRTWYSSGARSMPVASPSTALPEMKASGCSLEAHPCLSLWERCPSAHTGAERVVQTGTPSQSAVLTAPPVKGAMSQRGSQAAGMSALGVILRRSRRISTPGDSTVSTV